MISVNDLKTGLTLEIDGGLWNVVEFMHVKPGKGAAFVRTKLKNAETGNVVEKTFRAGEKVAKAAVTPVTSTVTGVFGAAGNTVAGVGNFVKGLFTGNFEDCANSFAKAGNSLISPVTDTVSAVGDCFEEFLLSFRPDFPNPSNVKAEKGFLDKLEMTMVGFVGSIAFAFQNILLQVLENHNIKCSKILKNPMDGLIEYYKKL